MANGTTEEVAAPIPLQPQYRSHVLIVVLCISFLGALSIGVGAWLISNNHESGGTLLISTGGTGTITGLIGLLSMSKQTPAAPTTGATATATATAPKPAAK
jgi:hypothetical protein